MAEPFQPRFVDLVRNFTSSQGTGNFVLGTPVNGFTSFATAILPGESFYYSAMGVDTPAEREVGRGTMQVDGTISRDPIGGVLTNFSSGTKTLALVAAAEWFTNVQAGAGGDGSGSTSVSVDSRAALASLATFGSPMILTESGREGLFVFEGGDNSAEVAADTAQGIYVAPSSDATGASGAWVRMFDGPVNPLWFGLTEGDDDANGAANDATMLEIFSALAVRATPHFSSTAHRGMETIAFPVGIYWFDSTIDLTDGAVAIEGAGGTGLPWGYPTVFKFSPGTTGIRVQRSNTEGGDGTAVGSSFGGDASTIRGLALIGGFEISGTEGEHHGIHVKARCLIENIYIDHFEGDGIYCAATAGSGTAEGNANNTRVNGVRVQRCRNGVYIDGADANIWSINAVDCSSNRQWGVWDSSFLGNSYFACHTASNGYGDPTSVVSDGTNRYYVIVGQEAGASTNAPSGTTADNTWWAWLGAGGFGGSNQYPEWVSGIAVRAGGSYHTDNLNADNIFVGCYTEGGQGTSQFVRPTLALGGTLADSSVGSGASLSGGIGGLFARPTLSIQATNTASTSTTTLGEQGLQTTVLKFSDTATAPNSWRLKHQGNDLRLDYASGNANVPFLITGPNTAFHFGTGAPVPYALFSKRLYVGDDYNNGRLLTNGIAAPTSGAHARGEIVWNRNAAAGGVSGWVCTVAGTPGTWAAMYDIFTSSVAGLVPASGGGSTNFLRADGSWVAPPSGSGGLSDGDHGDISVSGSGTVLTIDTGAVTYAKIQGVSAEARILGRASGAGPGEITELTSAQARAVTGIVMGVGFHCAGAPAASEVIGGMIAPYAFTISQASSSVKALVAATSATIITIRNNGGEIGTASFGAGTATATMSVTATAVMAGDQITFHAPATPDATLADIDGLLRE